jgi:hypothetical protein
MHFARLHPTLLCSFAASFTALSCNDHWFFGRWASDCGLTLISKLGTDAVAGPKPTTQEHKIMPGPGPTSPGEDSIGGVPTSAGEVPVVESELIGGQPAVHGDSPTPLSDPNAERLWRLEEGLEKKLVELEKGITESTTSAAKSDGDSALTAGAFAAASITSLGQSWALLLDHDDKHGKLYDIADGFA